MTDQSIKDLANRSEPAANLSTTLDETSAYTPTHDGLSSTLPYECDPLTGTNIGRYKLLRKIGEGGMGAVWMADQTEPVKRQVAVKLIRAERRQTHTILARFEAERQAIAMMDHPHIAKLLDAGTADNGSPYFVMELVKGVPLTKFCDHHRLDVSERLTLFMQICGAVQHAHQKGIIHRDLKPSNILVEMHDGKSMPKVIDFGLAKAISDLHLTDHTLATMSGNVLGTPLYMAPEQAGFSSLDVDTRSDIYTLGVILYELLTGTTPISRETMKQADLEELLRLIREHDAPTPSSRLNSAESKSDVAANRRIEPARLGRIVKGELDWITLKALSKDRDLRYETASSFAKDIERFLNNDPVLAGPPSASYRFKKFVRRNRSAVIGVSAVTLALLAGIVGITLALFVAWRHEQEAKEQEKFARKETVAKDLALKDAEKNLDAAKKSNEIMGDVFAGLDPSGKYETIGELRNALKQNLLLAAKKLEGSSIGDPLTVAAMQEKLGFSLLNLAEPTAAIDLFTKCRATRTAILGAEHFGTINCVSNIASCYRNAGKVDLAMPLYKEAVKLWTSTHGPYHPDTLTSMNNLAAAYHDCGQQNLSISLMDETWKLQKTILGSEHTETLRSMNNLGSFYRDAGMLDVAVPLLEESLKLHQKKYGREHYFSINSMNTLATCYVFTGKLHLGLPLMEEAVKLSRVVLGPDHTETFITMNNLSRCYHSTGNLDSALLLMNETRKLMKTKLGDDHILTLGNDCNLADCLLDASKYDLALPLLIESLSVMKTKLGKDHPTTLQTMNNLAKCYHCTGKLDLALPLFEETLKLRKAKMGNDHQDTHISMSNLAVAYHAVGMTDRSLPLMEESLKLKKAKLGLDHSSTLTSMNNLALIYQGAGKLDLAISLLQETLKLQKGKLGTDHPSTLISMNNLALGYHASNKLDLALPLWEETLKLTKMKLGTEHSDTLTTMNNLAMGYRDAGYLDRAMPLFEETLTLSNAKLGPAHLSTLNCMNNLAITYLKAKQSDKAVQLYEQYNTILRKLPAPQFAGHLAQVSLELLRAKQFIPAEKYLRECLGIREKLQPDVWSTFNSHSQLGESLLGQKQYAQAEPLLLKGYEGMKQRLSTIPPQGRPRLSEALDRLIFFYSESGKPDEVKRWQTEKERYQKTEPVRK